MVANISVVKNWGFCIPVHSIADLYYLLLYSFSSQYFPYSSSSYCAEDFLEIEDQVQGYTPFSYSSSLSHSFKSQLFGNLTMILCLKEVWKSSLYALRDVKWGNIMVPYNLQDTYVFVFLFIAQGGFGRK